MDENNENIELMEQGISYNDIPVNIEDVMHTNYLQYSLSVNIGRAIPDVRDGLKPGNRRILYAMHKLGLTKGRGFVKSARVVGEVIGKYHPHGDQAVYDTMVRMAQDFNMSVPLVDGQGNFGSIDGDAAAAHRYTECRMERPAEELLQDLEKETVEMVPTFDESMLEPSVLPARFPNILVNGATGIGVGMATSIPPHNLGEVVRGAIEIIDNPAATTAELMQHIPGPDLPTGASICGLREIVKLYETGRGIIRIKAKATIEETKDGAEQIVITEIPYAVNKERTIKKIADLIRDKVITGIRDITDASSKRLKDNPFGIKIVIDIKRNASANVVLNQLYKHTPLASSMGCQLLVIHKNRPVTMNLKQVLQAYVDHRWDVINRRNIFDRAKAQDRAHILEGLLKAVNNIDEVVKIIKDSRTSEEASTALRNRFELSFKQAKAILAMRLSQLTGLAIDALQEEYDELMERIAYLTSLIESRELTMGVVRDELEEIHKKYATDRRTELVPGDSEINLEDLIARRIVAITVSNTGYIKRMNMEEFRKQNRGGKGVIGMKTKEDDYVEHLFTACTHDYILFFTNRGQMRWLKAYEIPESGRTGKGQAIVNLFDLEEGEQIRAMLTTDSLDVEDRYAMMATKNGVIKKTELKAFRHLRKKGIRALNIREGDDLIEVAITNGENHVMLSSAFGKACRFLESDVRPMGRTAAGVRGINLAEGDEVVAMSVLNPTADIMVITELGQGKRTHVGEGNAEADADIVGGYRLTKRGGKGVTSVKLGDDDKVVAALQIEEDCDIMMMSVKGQMVRIGTDQIRSMGRACKGVRVMSFKDKGDRITSVSKIAEMAEDDEVVSEVELDENGNPVVAVEGNEVTAEAPTEAPETTTEEAPSADSAE